MAEAEVYSSNEMTRSYDVSIDLYQDYICTTITTVRSSGKRPDLKSIFSFKIVKLCAQICTKMF